MDSITKKPYEMGKGIEEFKKKWKAQNEHRKGPSFGALLECQRIRYKELRKGEEAAQMSAKLLRHQTN